MKNKKEDRIPLLRNKKKSNAKGRKKKSQNGTYQKKADTKFISLLAGLAKLLS
ncbi:hypothetical protein [Leptospira licerasiae]|uniref:hypothetical protein n=1 Tax=Leptospira licerasiae TaxID=447106 RepID=UPI001E33A01F|nr:hypothetical protein [Leptospira licerasiae]